MSWADCKKVLCIRADNMGDVIMSGPAIRALKETFNWNITLLTSSAGALICDQLPDIDNVIVNDLAWVRTDTPANIMSIARLENRLREEKFDAAIIFTVYSQSALPAAMVCMMAGIPVRLAYCRENPYHLLTHWIPDKEPYEYVRHQVQRDLDLVRTIGASVTNTQLMLDVSPESLHATETLLSEKGIRPGDEYVVVHPGVSEHKRRYPVERWIAIIRSLTSSSGRKVILTGSTSERALTNEIEEGAGNCRVKNLAGELDVHEFVSVIFKATVVMTVNTSTVHIAAAAGVPQVVLYAATNPQHTPWQAPSRVLYFPVDEQFQSRNEVIRYAMKYFDGKLLAFPPPDRVVAAALELISARKEETASGVVTRSSDADYLIVKHERSFSSHVNGKSHAGG